MKKLISKLSSFFLDFFSTETVKDLLEATIAIDKKILQKTYADTFRFGKEVC